MYRINDLNRNVLIVPDEVLFHAPIGHEPNLRSLRQSIIIAEERFVRPALSSGLYNQLITSKNKLVTNLNKELLEQNIYDETGEGVALNIGNIVNSRYFLSDREAELWDMFLWKLTAECVAFISVPEAFIQQGSAGLVHLHPQSSPMVDSKEVTPELRSAKWLMDKKLQDRIDPLIEAMKFWICENKNYFSTYTGQCDCSDQNQDGVSWKRKTSYVFGVYDEEENCGCKF